ncbi:tyrosine-type recombinase/integrase [Roseobacter sp. HKCCD9010]|uniref:tyrosine-type recombinase/integrase n=1 Tax=unclassified Roseobacter TaxID=196798 RepID=UPI001492A1E9|nr:MULTISPECIES: site-specific integrase [unclassified Roseobacter]MBF9049792.1 tyrosine-type recombinase/integrase [Rhodobacterales bacterium HKCCD4356]NNV13669.1 tyrosine-type recombinase/integrase [Roseobacter sp. HKCCD7357]NNV16503.1 tyrosine-type recombinase/integrase [Roseobacter sp. HKCCD8768]NNV25962.1 tyrosine-type recombinase/integrase [Roseobacter sp. HKCCD8192]NNV30221.1 tyrosine-type recombinase/integrase [Roseobacter sp. HKCCD9061]
MRKPAHVPSLSSKENVRKLRPRNSPYWNILEFCRHIGLQKLASGRLYWMARVRRLDGGYSQTRLGPHRTAQSGGLTYEEALEHAKNWFNEPDVLAVASEPYPAGINRELHYTKVESRFTVGDAMHSFVEWKRIAAARTYFETTLSLINHHIIPRLGHLPVEELSQSVFTQFCIDFLETAPKRGRGAPEGRVRLEELDHERLRKRKKILNTIIGLLRTAIEMSWENGDIDSELHWRRFRRMPHADTPRQFFLTRAQAKRVIASCRPDLALLVQGALYTGCRVSELACLKARDVGGHAFGIYAEPPKSYRGRYVVLPNEGMTFFLDQVEALDDEDLVFRMSSGRLWSGCHKHLFREAVRRAGLPEGFVFHGLRHTYASQLLQAGTPLAMVAKQLGHTNTDTVSRTYGHLCCDGLENEILRRFAPLQTVSKDSRLQRLRNTLQSKTEPQWSWPRKSMSKASGELVSLLRQREDELK